MADGRPMTDVGGRGLSWSWDEKMRIEDGVMCIKLTFGGEDTRQIKTKSLKNNYESTRYHTRESRKMLEG